MSGWAPRLASLALLALLALLGPATAQTQPPAYPWATPADAGIATRSLLEAFPTPAGFTRAAAPPSSFAAFLRELPVRLDRTTVLDFRGLPLDRPSVGVVLMDVGSRDNQQCADTILRLFAEWRYSRGEAQDLAFHFTSGDVTRFSEWVKGERIVAAGRGVRRTSGAPRGRGHESFRTWLDLVFRYAGTQSLRFDTVSVTEVEPLRAGDLFVEPGSPGHAVILLDVAESADGRRVALVGQGFMPAEELHVLRADATANVGGVWFVLPGPGGTLDTPSWRPFARASARRLPGAGALAL